MMWKEILKNIQISSQRTSSRDYVRPDEDDDTCRERFYNMMAFIENNWDSSIDMGDEDVDKWPDEIFCKALEHINKQTFLFYNPYEVKPTDLYKYRDAFEYYGDANFRSDITLDLGMGFHLKLVQRMVAVRSNVINIFCQLLMGNHSMMSYISYQIYETFNVGGDEFTNLLSEEAYDDGVTTISIPKDKEPSYITSRDWRQF